MDEPEKKDEGEETSKKFTVRTPTDIQRIRLEKLMKNPAKEVIIPELPKEKDFLNSAPSFVRNVMGSSAGAGSGEFHVYRHLRRKEFARQKYIEEKSRQEQLDIDFQNKLDDNKKKMEEKTAKKREKRLKKKKNRREKRQKPNDQKEESKSEDEDNQSSDNSDSEEKKPEQPEQECIDEKQEEESVENKE